ncbi:MAG TPA: hypothetical protein VGX92_18420 [Pyrinomonadaceae bacterium]|jgi:ElaB/YqjD/DUF883 family membrane-anchored ribosome-binding protein|nr:hypothetical protein [Pyrinomonadaceae bacterium]
MAERKRASALVEVGEDTPGKAELQRRMESTRESISQTVDEIKDTVSEQYENVKETVGEVLDWKEQFQKNPLVWGIGAVAVGLAVGYSMALLRQGGGGSSRGRRRGSQTDDFTDTVFDGLATLGQSYILPAVTHKVKELFGVDITEELMGHTRRPTARKSTGRKRTATKGGAKKKATRKRAARKSGEK